MTDRERAIAAIRRGVPLGEVVMCSCHTKPPTRHGCFGVCEDSVAAIIASYEALRRTPLTALELIADIAEGSQTINSLPHIAKIARGAIGGAPLPPFTTAERPE